MVLYNFRADRMVEISKAFEYEEFSAFDRQRFPKVLHLQASDPRDGIQAWQQCHSMSCDAYSW